MIRRPEKETSRRSYLLFLLIPLISILLSYYFIGTTYIPRERVTVLFLTDPVEVASFEPIKHQWSRVQFPASTHVAGIQGLGEYAVDSLWNIAATEGSPSAVVLGSITDELGVPIEYYVGDKGKIWGKHDEQTNVTAHFFSLSGMLKRLNHTIETNIPITLYIALTKSFRSTPAHKVTTAFLDVGRGLGEKKLPDNSTILEFDRDQYDSFTSNIFEDRQIREEHVRVAVFNTTGRPFLGSRVARIINRLGANVVQVGNEDIPVEECEVIGMSDQLTTQTSQSIQQLFRCKAVETNESGRADLTVKIGKVYERRFLPKE